MPTVSKIPASTGLKAKPAPNGSVLSEVVPVSELNNDLIRMCVYGGNRVGKTTFACQFPKPLLLVSFEPNDTGGAKSVKKIPGVSYLHMKVERDPATGKLLLASEKTLRLIEELRAGVPFKTHVWDGATSYQDVCLQELLNLDETPVQLGWGSVSPDVYRARSEMTKAALQKMLSLPAHTVVLAKEKDHNPPKDDKGNPMRNKLTRGFTQESHFASDLGQATVQWLHDACDYVARLYIEKEVKETEIDVGGGQSIKQDVETGRNVRRLRTMLHPNYSAGFRSENPSAVPEYIEAATPKEMYDAVMQVIDGKKTDKGRYQ